MRVIVHSRGSRLHVKVQTTVVARLDRATSVPSKEVNLGTRLARQRANTGNRDRIPTSRSL